jgi:hypothetical protein
MVYRKELELSAEKKIKDDVTTLGKSITKELDALKITIDTKLQTQEAKAKQSIDRSDFDKQFDSLALQLKRVKDDLT